MASVRKRRWTHEGVEREAWIVAYVDNKGKRRQKTFERKKDADKFRIGAESELLNGGAFGNEEMTVKTLCETFIRREELRVKDGRLEELTLYANKLLIDKYIVPQLGHIKLAKLTVQNIDNFYAFMSKECKLSPRSMLHRLRLLRSIEAYAVSRNIMSKTPVDAMMKEMRSLRTPRVRAFTIEEAHLVLQHAAIRRPFQRPRNVAFLECITNLAAFCGLRRGEILGLTLPAVDFAEGVIYVRHNLTAWDKLKTPKTRAGVRVVPMPAHVAAILRGWIATWQLPDERGLLFRTANGSAFCGSYIYLRLWRPLLKSIGLEPKPNEGWPHFHALRHFYASLMIQHRMPVNEVSSLIGHSRTSTTLDVYTHLLTPQRERGSAVQSIATAFLASNPAARPQHETQAIEIIET